MMKPLTLPKRGGGVDKNIFDIIEFFSGNINNHHPAMEKNKFLSLLLVGVKN